MGDYINFQKSKKEKMKEGDKNNLIESTRAPETPRRIAFFPKKTPARFEDEKPPEKLVMTFAGLFFNAPLEELANPEHTPNPAKAPWYFLGLQELLHNFPPIVAGVIIPLLVIISLVIIPYFDINIKREGLWIHNPRRTFIIFSIIIFTVVFLCALYQAFSIVIPSLLLYNLAILPYFVKKEKNWIRWLARRSLAEWVMTWFVIVTTVLTLIGTFFRGPGWSWIWPWQ
jgi:quinol-cytochrome oxidoreductase complex cytochrome b subunit